MDIVKHNTQTGESEEMQEIFRQIRQTVKESQLRTVSDDDEEIPPKSKKPCLIKPNENEDGEEDEKMVTED